MVCILVYDHQNLLSYSLCYPECVITETSVVIYPPAGIKNDSAQINISCLKSRFFSRKKEMMFQGDEFILSVSFPAPFPLVAFSSSPAVNYLCSRGLKLQMWCFGRFLLPIHKGTKIWTSELHPSCECRGWSPDVLWLRGMLYSHPSSDDRIMWCICHTAG